MPWEWQGCVHRRDAFPPALKKLDPTAKVIKSYPTKGFGPTEGYDVATQVVPAMKGKFNFVYTLNDAIGLGVIKALKENGLTPGKDVLVVGGTCLGKATNKAVVNGRVGWHRGAIAVCGGASSSRYTRSVSEQRQQGDAGQDQCSG